MRSRDEFGVGDVVMEIGGADEWLIYTLPSERQYFVKLVPDKRNGNGSCPSFMSFHKNWVEKNFVRVKNLFVED